MESLSAGFAGILGEVRIYMALSLDTPVFGALKYCTLLALALGAGVAAGVLSVSSKSLARTKPFLPSYSI